MRIGVAERRKPDEVERVIDALAPAPQNALGLEAQGDVVPDRPPGKQGRILEHDDARRMRAPDARLVLPQPSCLGLVEPGDEPEQGRLAAARGPQQRNELAGLDRDADVAQHRQLGPVDVEGVADLLDVERGAGGRMRDRFGKSCGYHLTVPFCQTRRRSRIANSSVIAPEQSSDITISAAYMLA